MTSVASVVGQADARAIPLPSGTVQCVVTSPPYLGERAYDDVRSSIWATQLCSHEWEPERFVTGPRKWDTNTGKVYEKQTTKLKVSRGSFCRHCGAWKGALGLEPYLSLYVLHVVGIMREVRRVLRGDGVLFLNLGDTYATNKGPDDMAPKQLCGVPWRVALAMQDDGWWVRNEVIWAQGMSFNEGYGGRCYPEACRDRFARAHEHLFVMTKGPQYSWNPDEAKEPNAAKDGMRNVRDVWAMPATYHSGAHFAVFARKLVKTCLTAASNEGDLVMDPFAGTGTVGEVAQSLGRRYALFDLSRTYLRDHAFQRLGPLFVNKVMMGGRDDTRV